ncbi:MAG: PilZ domain-containing protein [Candidatus Omnitrophica bacterium]|nr:PilZ domain-containing protein [Candidatus Omnitrophota bacterium]
MNIENSHTHVPERRKYVRFKKSYILKCEHYTIPRKADEQEINSASKNISAGGILFESNSSYNIGDILKLEINLPQWEKDKPEFYKATSLSSSQPLIALGTVMRVEIITEGLFDIGVCFSAVDEGHLMALIRYIDERIKEKKK